MLSRRTLLSVSALGGFGALGMWYGWRTGRIALGPVDLPEVALPPVPGVTFAGAPVPGVDTQAFRDKLVVLNFWASWCPYCRSEHHLLMELAADPKLALVGVVMDDTAEKVAGYLNAEGNPFRYLSIDAKREIIRPMRQRGVPSTLVIPPGQTRSAFKHPGALTKPVIANALRPVLDAALTGQPEA